PGVKAWQRGLTGRNLACPNSASAPGRRTPGSWEGVDPTAERRAIIRVGPGDPGRGAPAASPGLSTRKGSVASAPNSGGRFQEGGIPVPGVSAADASRKEGFVR